MISKEEVKAMAEMSHESGGLELQQTKYIKEILQLDDVLAKDIMTYKIDMVAIDITATIEDIKLLIKKGYTRIPVFDDDQKKLLVFSM